MGRPKEFLCEGDSVKLNLLQIKSHPDWNKCTSEHRAFVKDNADTVFTVEYDRRRKDRPNIVCLKEDESKRLFHVIDLLVLDKTTGKFRKVRF